MSEGLTADLRSHHYSDSTTAGKHALLPNGRCVFALRNLDVGLRCAPRALLVRRELSAFESLAHDSQRPFMGAHARAFEATTCRRRLEQVRKLNLILLL